MLIKPESPKSQILQAALEYKARGWQPIPVPFRSKAPVAKGWQKLRLSAEQIEHVFGVGQLNVGIVLGEPSNWLVDIDLDHRLAVALAPAFLPQTDAIFGRTGKPRSHWLYVARGAKPQRFVAANLGTIAEIRSTGQQTVFPPSVHPSGERIAWAEEGEPSVVDAAQLSRAVARLAAAVALALTWPEEGARHDAALALGGVLARAGWDEETAEDFVRVVALAAGDDEPEDRARAARDSVIRYRAGETVTGIPRLAEFLPDGAILKQVLEWLGIDGGGAEEDQEEGSDRETIELGTETLAPHIREKAFNALRRRFDGELFMYGSAPVHVVEGRMHVLSTDVLGGLLSRAVRFVRRTEKGFVEKDPPERLIRTMFAELPILPKMRSLPPLRAIVRAPVVFPSGEIVAREGYHQAGLIFYDLPRIPLPEIPPGREREVAKAAYEELRRLLDTYTFASPADESAAIAYIMTAVLRPVIPLTPLFLIVAPQEGAGKTLLAQIGAILKCGETAETIPEPENEEELRKRIDAAVLAGRDLIILDNIAFPNFRSATLESIITSKAVEIRVLGRSESRKIPNVALFVATGNNVTPAGDLRRRAITIKIVPRGSVFSQYPKDLLREVRERRGEILTHILTLVAAYIRVEKPTQAGLPFPSFDEWARLIRDPILWVGAADPVLTVQRTYEEDAREAALKALFEAVTEAWGTRPFTTAELADLIRERGLTEAADLLGVTEKNGDISAKRLGWRLRALAGRYVAGLKLEMVKKTEGRQKWQVLPFSTEA